MAITWLKSYKAMAHHPKVKRLARVLGVNVAQAIGHLHLLWWWAVDYAEDGDLSRFDADEIACAAEWEDDAGKFIDALAACGFIDRDDDGLTLHNWDYYMAPLFAENEKNAERCKRYRERQKGKNSDIMSTSCRNGNDTGIDTPLDKTRLDKTKTRLDKTRQDETRLDALALDFPDLEPLELIAPANASAQESDSEVDDGDGDGGKRKRKRTPKPTVHEMPIQGAPYSAKAHDYFFAIEEFVPAYEPDAMREIRFIQDLMAQYPEKNIEAEFLKALCWCKDNPEKARKKKNLRQFMRNWMARAEPDPNRMFVPVQNTGFIAGGDVDG